MLCSKPGLEVRHSAPRNACDENANRQFPRAAWVTNDHACTGHRLQQHNVAVMLQTKFFSIHHSPLNSGLQAAAFAFTTTIPSPSIASPTHFHNMHHLLATIRTLKSTQSSSFTPLLPSPTLSHI